MSGMWRGVRSKQSGAAGDVAWPGGPPAPGDAQHLAVPVPVLGGLLSTEKAFLT